MFPFSRVLYLDLLPSDSFTPTLHLVAYSVNQKGRSEPTVLEDIAINEAEKRTGMSISFHSRRGNLIFSAATESYPGVVSEVVHITPYINSVVSSTA